jgi:hypothetical protein
VPFDLAVFVDHGRVYYDNNNKKVDGPGIVFKTPRRVEAERRRLQRNVGSRAKRTSADDRR